MSLANAICFEKAVALNGVLRGFDEIGKPGLGQRSAAEAIPAPGEAGLKLPPASEPQVKVGEQYGAVGAGLCVDVHAEMSRWVSMAICSSSLVGTTRMLMGE